MHKTKCLNGDFIHKKKVIILIMVSYQIFLKRAFFHALIHVLWVKISCSIARVAREKLYIGRIWVGGGVYMISTYHSKYYTESIKTSLLSIQIDKYQKILAWVFSWKMGQLKNINFLSKNYIFVLRNITSTCWKYIVEPIK